MARSIPERGSTSAHKLKLPPQTAHLTTFIALQLQMGLRRVLPAEASSTPIHVKIRRLLSYQTGHRAYLKLMLALFPHLQSCPALRSA